MTAARGGEVCQTHADNHCTEDSHQVCCSCCALGLRLRAEGRGCHAHQYLGYPCGHILLTCCEEEEGPGQPPLTRKEKPQPTALPKKVSDSKIPKEALSLSIADSDGDDSANSVEEEGGGEVDWCQLYLGQLCHHTCLPAGGSYRCACRHGYALLEDGHTCVAESPEEENSVRVEDRLSREPVVTTAAPTTTTITTTTATTTTTVPHNPCTGTGGCSQQCSVVGGRALCSCFPGFSLALDGRVCEDVNECLTQAHRCQPRERCVNTLGSFVCERQVTCPPGYQLRNNVCEDIDECMVRTHNCGVGFECQNSVGSFLCNPKQKCLTGFTQDAHGNCIDINECSTLSEPCSAGFNCINTVGSYACQRKVVACSPGYHSSADGARCTDVDECQTGVHRCGEGQVCHNLPGSYRCDCQTGYQYDALRKVCTDVNECWRYPGRLCAQTCDNTPGSYQCSCTAGFSLAFDGKNCEDLNECDSNPCSQECANIYGSYQCYCRQGFYLKEDGHTCEDIDECSQSIGNLCAFQCVNVPGSYQCACPPAGSPWQPTDAPAETLMSAPQEATTAAPARPATTSRETSSASPSPAPPTTERCRTPAANATPAPPTPWTATRRPCASPTTSSASRPTSSSPPKSSASGPAPPTRATTSPSASPEATRKASSARASSTASRAPSTCRGRCASPRTSWWTWR